MKTRLYNNEEWRDFSARVKERDGYSCLKCGRGDSEAVLQVHHKRYQNGLAPWEYALSDCLTLCKGCHAVEHGLIEPDRGWTLVSMDDLQDISGVCERKGCGKEIRYAHLAYHPQWGYKTVGSKCVEILTRSDQDVSRDIIKLLSNISAFLYKSDWKKGITQSGSSYKYTTYRHSQIRIYGDSNNYAFQIALKVKGQSFLDFQKTRPVPGKSRAQVIELAFIALKGLITEDDEKKHLLRNMYRSLIQE